MIVTIGLLAMGILSYIRDDEHTTRYKAEACLNKIQAKVTNYVNAALTSKKIGEIFPEQYVINFSNNTVTLSGLESTDFSEVCWKKGFSLQLTGSTFEAVFMNKGFRQLHANQPYSFQLTGSSSNIFTGEVKINLCRNDNCDKEFARRIVDARSQTIGFQYCLFYSGDNLNTCNKRQN